MSRRRKNKKKLSRKNLPRSQRSAPASRRSGAADAAPIGGVESADVVAEGRGLLRNTPPRK